jgi:uncharacterized protein YdbL (DUF1318 family)
MKRYIFLPALFQAMLLLFSVCSIKAPEVQVTGEKTALEKEVLGTYERLEEDTWMIASSRSARKTENGVISIQKEKVLEAMQRQKFNKDDVDEFKRQGYLGENNQGLLELRSVESLQNNPESLKLVKDIMAEENEDRITIRNRVIELKSSLQEQSREEILAVFAKMYQSNSEKNVWIQKADGSWIQK